MGGNTEFIAGHGYLSLGQAVHVAQNSEGGVDQRLAQFLEKRLAEVWAKLNSQPHTYVLLQDEFALMNYYRTRFGDNEIIKNATKRFWDNYKVFLWLQHFTYNRVRKFFLYFCTIPLDPEFKAFILVQDISHLTFSNGVVFNGSYFPPNCSYNRVTFNFTVTSAGRQFDRLALMFFNDTEILRTSTAEPTKDGIIWSYVKDMSNFMALFDQPHKIIFDLGNLIDDTYTGSWNTTLTATFFTEEETLEPADVIIPLSARRSIDDSPSGFVVPETRALNSLSLPQNARNAIFTISACGQAAEEFWWSNVLTSDAHAFGNGTTLYGHSPFRELRLLIDGQLAGVAWPFPVIFTGGVVPGFWRPVVGIDAFDLREDEIDITPFLPLLSDGLEHSFEIQVVGIDDDGHGNATFTTAIESNWVVTGKVFVWLDSSDRVSSGAMTSISVPEPVVILQSVRENGPNGTVKSIDYLVEVKRNILIQSTLLTEAGPATVTWAQNLTFSNSGAMSNSGNDQTVRQNTVGKNTSPALGYAKLAAYPLQVVSSYDAPTGGNVSINATMSRGKHVRQLGELAFLNEWRTLDPNRHLQGQYAARSFTGSNVQNTQTGNASYLSVPAEKRSYGSGTTEQLYVLSGVSDTPTAVIQNGINANGGGVGWTNEELYRRKIVAVNDSIAYDDETFRKQTTVVSVQDLQSTHVGADRLHEYAERAVRLLLGRGPS